MDTGKLHIYKDVEMQSSKLVLGFSGWMDGGEVSTGTVRMLVERFGAEMVAEIDRDNFYIENFPGNMDLSALFRPHTKIIDGLIEYVDWPKNRFYCDKANGLIFFQGVEPNMNWHHFSNNFFEFCQRFNVKEVYFVGSISGLVPHTRDPKFMCLVSNEHMKQRFEKYGFDFNNYEGPASVVTFLTSEAVKYNIEMASIISSVPAYVQGNNPICIAAVIRVLSGIMGFHLDIDDLRDMGDEYSKRLSDLVGEEPELEDNIRKLEENYDSELFDHEMGDLKQWLIRKGVRLD